MSDLVPEKRLNRLGRLVTKWIRRDKGESVRAAQLKEVAPTITASPGASAIEMAKDAKERDALGEELLTILQRDMTARVSGRDISRRDPEAEGRAVREVFDKMMGFETSTLRILRDYYTETGRNLLLPMEFTISDEVGLRERLHYYVAGNQVPKQGDLDTVKTALGVDDLSEFPKGTNEHAIVTTMLEIALKDKKMLEGRNHESQYDYVREASLVELGKTMRDYPDRSDAIGDYISDRGLLVREIEHWHLREYLDTPAPALSEGLL